MTEIDEYEAMQEDEPAAQPSESPDEKSQTEELLPMLHYMSSVLDQLKEAATALQEEREKLQTYGSRLKGDHHRPFGRSRSPSGSADSDTPKRRSWLPRYVCTDGEEF